MANTTGATRMERDSLGELPVPADAYYGIQTQRALLNFPISGTPMPRPFIRAHVMLKKAAALVNTDLGLLDKRLADPIVTAEDEIIADAEWSRGQFPVDIYQTGSGTSTNMNLNEVIASRANEILGGKRGDKTPIHPNDHVNLGQSSNDSIPTSMHVMSRVLIDKELHNSVGTLVDSLHKKVAEFWPVIKTGRTHLQDATPIRLGQEFGGYNGQIGGILTGGLITASSPGISPSAARQLAPALTHIPHLQVAFASFFLNGREYDHRLRRRGIILRTRQRLT